MTFVQWCELFVIGHQIIDEQHRELFNIINKFHDEFSAGFAEHLADDTLNQLIGYVQKHFADEEEIAEAIGYPEDKLASHKKIHEQLVLDIFELHSGITGNGSVSLDDVSEFLTRWIVLHILDALTLVPEEAVCAASSDQHKELLMPQIVNIGLALLLSPGPSPLADGNVVFLK